MQTHIPFTLEGETGNIYGEFSKDTNQPDGRCIFKNLTKGFTLAFFKDGSLACGPYWRVDRTKRFAEIYSNTWYFGDKKYAIGTQI